ncbi:MAG TPA: hypoxanthine-guanine phosphoribosyltransferase [Gammaproteobacteria bacterium]
MDARLDDAITARRAARVLLTADEVGAVYDRMARSIAGIVAECNPVVLAVMHGGVFTAVELCRRFDFAYEFGYVHATRYAGGLEGGTLDWHVEPRPELEGRTVLVVDDILDEGLTLAALEHALRERRVAALYKAVFAVKNLRRPVERPAVDWAGTEVPDVYVFGCGMDYRGYWRGVPELLAVSPRQDAR